LTAEPLRHRSFGLDVVRAIAIVFVLITHTAVFWPLSTTGPDPVKYGILPVFGLIGVELFFGLSGYLIGQILLKHHVSLRRFYLHRLTKILPPYYLVVAGIALVTAAPWPVVSAHLFFIQNFDPDLATFFPVSWSLSIEFWFYAVVPLIFWRAHHSRIIVRRLIALIALILLARLIQEWYLQPDWEFGIHRAVPLRMDALLFGVLAAVIDSRYRSVMSFICRPVVAWLNVGIVVTISAWFGQMFFKYDFFEAAHSAKAIIFTLTGLTVMQLILAAKHHLKVAARYYLVKNVISWLSQISYSLYLIHSFIFSYLAATGLPPVQGLIISLSASLAGASLVYYGFEISLVLRVRRWVERRWLAGT
jgi:peptidoglycan/LPS O-acetylase OafA/YrhL